MIEELYLFHSLVVTMAVVLLMIFHETTNSLMLFMCVTVGLMMFFSILVRLKMNISTNTSFACLFGSTLLFISSIMATNAVFQKKTESGIFKTKKKQFQWAAFGTLVSILMTMTPFERLSSIGSLMTFGCASVTGFFGLLMAGIKFKVTDG